MKHAILCVDDEKDILDALERLLKKKFEVFKAVSGDEALQILKEQKISLIISDQRMPMMTGIEFLKRSREIQPEAMRLLLTGYTDIESVIEAINQGQIYHYLTKPWNSVDLMNIVDKALEAYDMNRELKEKNKALTQALDQLKVLDEAKSQFMILINHELKIPLTVMTGFLDLLKNSELNEEQQKYCDRIQQSHQKLLSMVQDVLEIVSAHTGQLKSNPVNLSPENIFEGSWPNVFEALLQQKEQTLKLDLCKDEFKADLQQVEKILTQLIQNAIRFADEKSVIEVSCQPQESGQLRWSILNDGPTIDKETIAKILQPFSVGGNIMNHSEGMGLGLSLCQALLTVHDSQLEFKPVSKGVHVSFCI